MMDAGLFLLVVLPVLAGCALLLLKAESLKKEIAFFISLISLISAVMLFIRPAADLTINLVGDFNIVLGLNALSRFILVFINVFVFLVCWFSKDYISKKGAYFSYLLWLAATSNLVALSADFIIFIFAWGAGLGLLYALLNLGSGQSAKKAFSIVGLADFSLLLGICLFIAATGTTAMPSVATVNLDNPLAWFSFILMLAGALAKAGCVPFHTWIPQASETAPVPVMAILPGSLDKLLGIYLLALICVDFFVLNNLALGLLLLIGSLTIIFAVMMALIQHDLRKLLSFHAISQVGYMVLGLGTGVPIGIMGGLFHMVNNAIYKSGLFLSGAAVGQKRNTFELERLGGLAAYMPLTFISTLVFSLSISGVPPFNGFASKWMLYQGALIGLFRTESPVLRFVYIFALVAAMFGSALTLASFAKLMHSVFLGQDNSTEKKAVREVSFNMGWPLLILAGLCAVLGIFHRGFLKMFIAPWSSEVIYTVGRWDSLTVFVFIIAGLLLGLILWIMYKGKTVRQDSLFVGGEEASVEPSFPGTEFYRGIEEMPVIKRMYRLMRIEAFDIYNVASALLKIISYILFILVDRPIYYLTSLVGYITLGLSWVFRRLHTGVLDWYLVWSLAGLLILFFILMAH